MKERFQNGIVADLLMIKNEDGKKKILLSKRKNTGYKDGEYELPGGHLEDNSDLRVYLGASKNKEKFYEKFGFIKRIDADLGYGMILTDN